MPDRQGKAVQRLHASIKRRATTDIERMIMRVGGALVAQARRHEDRVRRQQRVAQACNVACPHQWVAAANGEGGLDQADISH